MMVGPDPVPSDDLAGDLALVTVPSRQSPIAVIFIAWRYIRNLGIGSIGIFVVFLLSGRLPATLLGVGLVAATVGFAFMVVAWWRFVFVIEGDELRVTKGVISEERLTIPLDRVQSVSINQKALHRVVGLVSVVVDTAGSSEAELEIDAVERTTAEALQRVVAGHRRAQQESAAADPATGGPAVAIRPADRVLLKRTPIELVRIGATRWPWAGLVALAPLVAVLDDISGLLPDFIDEEQLVEDNLPSDFGPQLVAVVLALAIIGLVIAGVFGTALQVIREVVTNWNLTVYRTETGLRRTAGLLNTTSKASTLNRIQAIQTDQAPAQRLFDIRRLSLPTIGEGDLVIPGASEHEVTQMRATVFGRAEPPELDRRISRLFVFLAVRNRVLTVIPIGAVLVLTLGWWGLLIATWVPIEWLVARRRWRLRRWSMSHWRLAEYYELLNRHSAEFDLIKAQTVTVSRSFFERRRGLATVRVETADGHLAVPLIAVSEAKAVRDRVLFAVETDRRSWM